MRVTIKKIIPCSEADSEAGEAVGVGGEGEFAAVLVEHFACEEEADAVTVVPRCFQRNFL